MPKKKKRIKKYEELSALKGRIREAKSSYRQIAALLQGSSTSISNKINGWASFDLAEIEKIAIALEIPPDKIAYYFFPSMLLNSNMTNTKSKT